MKKYIFSLVCLCCTLLPALEGQAHEYPNHPELRKSDANIVGHILDKNTKEHLPYITVALKGTTIGTVTDATGHYFLKNLPEGNFVLESVRWDINRQTECDAEERAYIGRRFRDRRRCGCFGWRSRICQS